MTQVTCTEFLQLIESHGVHRTAVKYGLSAESVYRLCRQARYMQDGGKLPPKGTGGRRPTFALIPPPVSTAMEVDTGADAVAEQIAQAFGDRLLYDPFMMRWFLFGNVVYDVDTSSHASAIRSAIRNHIPKGVAVDVVMEHLKSVLEADKIRLAAVKAIDTKYKLLGFQNGVVDLQTGELRPGTPADRLSKQAAVAYRPFAAFENEDKERLHKYIASLWPNPQDLEAAISLVADSLLGNFHHKSFFLPRTLARRHLLSS